MQKKNFKIALFAIFCSIFSETSLASSASRALDLARNIKDPGATSQAGTGTTIPASTVIHDMQNKSLTELNIGVGSVGLIFIKTPWPDQPVISDLGFIPTGTKEFTLEIYGYNNSSQPLMNLKDLQTAITSGTIGGFAVQVYDVNDNAIGNPIQLSSDLVTRLKQALSSDTFSSGLGVNSVAVDGVAFSYPVSLRFENISGWTSSSSDITTLSNLVAAYNIPLANQVTKAYSSITEFNFNINDNQSVLPNNSGWFGAYAFIKDPWNNVTTEFSNGTGVAAVIPTATVNVFSDFTDNKRYKVSLALIAKDAQGNFIKDLTKTVPKTMDLYVFDQNGNIIGSPVVFPASNAIGLTAAPTFTENSFRGGLSGVDVGTLSYPLFVKFAKGSGSTPSAGSGGFAPTASSTKTTKSGNSTSQNPFNYYNNIEGAGMGL